MQSPSFAAPLAQTQAAAPDYIAGVAPAWQLRLSRRGCAHHQHGTDARHLHAAGGGSVACRAPQRVRRGPTTGPGPSDLDCVCQEGKNGPSGSGGGALSACKWLQMYATCGAVHNEKRASRPPRMMARKHKHLEMQDRVSALGHPASRGMQLNAFATAERGSFGPGPSIGDHAHWVALHLCFAGS
jgi:hypothetical protein